MKILKCTDEIAAIGMGSAHAVLGHPSYLLTSSTATKLGMRSLCANEICESCIKGKQRQKNVNKKVEFKAVKPGEKIYYDVSSIEHKSIGGAKFWLMFVDECTGFKRSYFLRTKKELTVCGLQYIDEMEMAKIKIEKFRCDNARENKKFTEKLSELKKNIITEYSAPGTPQQMA